MLSESVIFKSKFKPNLENQKRLYNPSSIFLPIHIVLNIENRRTKIKCQREKNLKTLAHKLVNLITGAIENFSKFLQFPDDVQTHLHIRAITSLMPWILLLPVAARCFIFYLHISTFTVISNIYSLL